MASLYDKGYRQAGRGETNGDLHCHGPQQQHTVTLLARHTSLGTALLICEFHIAVLKPSVQQNVAGCRSAQPREHTAITPLLHWINMAYSNDHTAPEPYTF